MTIASFREGYIQLAFLSKISYTCAGYHGLGTSGVTVSASPQNPGTGFNCTLPNMTTDPMILPPLSSTIRRLPDAKPVWFAAENISLSVTLAVKLFKLVPMTSVLPSAEAHTPKSSRWGVTARVKWTDPAVTPPSFPFCLRSSIPVDCQSEGLNMEENPAYRRTGEHLNEPPRLQVTADMVPDFALLNIFDFYMTEALDFDPFRHNREAWIVLAHVCRKWRDIVFGSPRRLNVRLEFTAQRSVRVMLDTWPPLPIDIWGSQFRDRDVGNIIAALEHSDRIHKIELWCSSKLHVKQALAAMQRPFPSLTELAVDFFHQRTVLVVPDLFLNGSAPLLRSLRLRNILFPLPVLRSLLLSATDLVEIRIWRIPDSSHIPPEAMVACLSALTRLEVFDLGFRSLLPQESQGLPQSTRCVLPALTSLRFSGPCKYLEHLIAPIDSPLLDNLDVILLHQPVLDTPQLAQFVDRTPKLKALHEAHIFFDGPDVFVSLPWTRHRGLHFRVRITDFLSNRHSILVQLCTTSFLRTLIPTMKHLYILDGRMAYLHWLDDVDGSQWVDLLRPFTTIEDLYLSRKFLRHIVPALHRIIGEGVTEVLPSLQNLFLEKQSPPGPVEEVIGQFVATLHLSSRPITVSQWDRVHDTWWPHEDR